VIQSYDSVLSSYQRWRKLGEIILIAGLALELLHAGFFDWYEAWLPSQAIDHLRKLIGTIFCTVLILFGVMVESWAGAHIDDVIREMRLPRHLTADQQAALAAALKPFSKPLPERADMRLTTGATLEADRFGSELRKVLKNAHWDAEFTGGNTLIVQGVAVYCTSEPKSQQAGKALVDGLLDAGIGAFIAPPDAPKTFIGCPPAMANKDKEPFCTMLLVIVGNKPLD